MLGLKEKVDFEAPRTNVVKSRYCDTSLTKFLLLSSFYLLDQIWTFFQIQGQGVPFKKYACKQFEIRQEYIGICECLYKLHKGFC